MTTRSLLTITFAVALAAVGTVWIHSLVPPDSPITMSEPSDRLSGALGCRKDT